MDRRGNWEFSSKRGKRGGENGGKWNTRPGGGVETRGNNYQSGEPGKGEIRRPVARGG